MSTFENNNVEMEIESMESVEVDDISDTMKYLIKQCFNNQIDQTNYLNMSEFHKNKIVEFFNENKTKQIVNETIKLPKPSKKTDNNDVQLCAVLIFKMMQIVKPRKILFLTKNNACLKLLNSYFKLDENNSNKFLEMGFLKEEKKMLFSSFFKVETAKSKKTIDDCIRNNFLTLSTTKLLENPNTHFIDLNHEDLKDNFLQRVDCLIVYESETLGDEEKNDLRSKFKNILFLKHKKK